MKPIHLAIGGSVMSEFSSLSPVAFITIDRAYAEYLLDLMKRAAQLKEQYHMFYAIKVFDWTPVLVDIDDNVQSRLGISLEFLYNEDYQVLDSPPDLDLLEDSEDVVIRTDTSEVTICSDYVYWNGYLKYSGERYETGSIPGNLIAEALQTIMVQPDVQAAP